MAFTLTHKTVYGSNDDAASFSTASVSWTPGAKAVVAVFSPGQPTPSIAGYSQVSSQQNPDTSRRVTVFESGSTPANGPVTVTFSAPAESCNIWVGEVPDGYGSPLVRQVVVDQWRGNTSPTLAFDPAPLPTSVGAVAVVSNSLNDFTFTEPFVGQPAGTTGTPPMRSEVSIAPAPVPASTVVTASGGTSIPHAAILLELQAATTAPVARILPADQQRDATGSFSWDTSESSGNAISRMLTILDPGTTGATNANIVGATTVTPSLDASTLQPGSGTVQLEVTDAASQTARATAAFTVVDSTATLAVSLWDVANQLWVQQDGVTLWDDIAWDGGTPPAAVAPQIIAQSANATVTAGQTTTLTVTASGTNPKTYQWQRGGVDVTGATTDTYSTPTDLAVGSYSYTCAVTNSAGTVTSAPVIVTVEDAPVTEPPPEEGTVREDVTLWPFLASSPANMPIGSEAVFGGSTHPMVAELQGSGQGINGNNGYGHPVYIATASDPSVTFQDTSISSRTKTGYCPANATPSTGTDRHMHVIQPDGFVIEMWLVTRPSTITNGSTITAARVERNDLRGSGILQGGVRAYGGSALTFLPRIHEVAARYYPHALAIGLHPDQMLKNGWVWPANTEDGGGNNSYAGTIPMGSLWAIPGAVNLDALGLNPDAYAIAKALQDYGGYVVDQANPFILFFQQGADNTRLTNIGNQQSTIKDLLRPVLNNGPDSVGGGGVPRVPLAPPIEGVEEPAPPTGDPVVPLQTSEGAYFSSGATRTDTFPNPLTVGSWQVAVCMTNTSAEGYGSITSDTGWTVPTVGGTEAARIGNSAKIVVWVKRTEAGDPATVTYTAPLGGVGGIRLYELPGEAQLAAVLAASGASGTVADLGAFDAAAAGFSLTGLCVIPSTTDKGVTDGFTVYREQSRLAWADKQHGVGVVDPDWVWVESATYGAVALVFTA